MKYFAIIGIITACAAEFTKAMMDGRVTRGEWIDIIFQTGDAATEKLIGFDLDPFRPIAEEVKAVLGSGQASLLGFLKALITALEQKGLDYRFEIPGEAQQE